MSFAKNSYVRSSLLLLTLAAAACAQAKKPDRASFIPEIEKLRPVFACIGKAAPGDTRLVEKCSRSGGIELSSARSDPPSLNDQRLQLVGMWVLFDSDRGRRLTMTDLDSALSYATCQETSAVNNAAFSSRTVEGVERARAQADLACASHPLSYSNLSLEAVNAGAVIEDGAVRMLARAFTGMSFDYALEKNGWKTDAMRPCARYLDGRPPSKGCEEKLEGRPTYPPPPPSPVLSPQIRR